MGQIHIEEQAFSETILKHVQVDDLLSPVRSGPSSALMEKPFRFDKMFCVMSEVPPRVKRTSTVIRHSEADPTCEPQAAERQPSSVLCISNDHMLAETRSLILQQAGYTTFKVTGAALSEGFELPPCDVVLVCHSVSEYEGYKLLATLEQYADPPSVMFLGFRNDLGCCLTLRIASASSEPESILRCLSDLLRQERRMSRPHST